MAISSVTFGQSIFPGRRLSVWDDRNKRDELLGCQSHLVTQASACTYASVDKPRHDIPVTARDLHLHAGIEDQETFAVSVRFYLFDEIKIDDG